MARVFISHSSKDKEFVRRLCDDLSEMGHSPWLDEWEVRVGDCIVKRVGEGLESADFVVLILSPNAVESGWVEREWAPSFWNEIETRRQIVLPVMLQDCSVPVLLKTKKYADFRKSYAVGFAQLTNALGPILHPIEPPSGEVVPPRDEELLGLLVKVQSRSMPLAACLAEALMLAKKRADAALQRFCELELTGYSVAKIARSDPDHPGYRLVEVYVSPFAEINTQYFGWGESASAVFAYMARDKHFTPISMLVPFSVAKLESMPAENTAKSIIHHVARWGDFDKDSQYPDTPLHIYGRAEAYANVLEAIRGELTTRLLALLPSAPEPPEAEGQKLA